MTTNERVTLAALIYDRLAVLAGDLTDLPARRCSHVHGAEPLTLRRLEEAAGATVINLAHSHSDDGAVVVAPSMRIVIYTRNGTAEALDYQDECDRRCAYGAGGRRLHSVADAMNAFLARWLHEATTQGHTL